MSELSILTFNAGLLRVSVFGRVLAEPTPFMEERYAHMASEIGKVNADVVAIQEIFSDAHRDGLAAALGSQYQHISRIDRRWWPNLGNGMLLLSKYPVDHAEHRRFADVDIQERIFVSKGMLLASVRVPDFGPMQIAVVHTTAGGTVHTESSCANANRSKNLKSVVGALREKDASLRLIVGDFNAGPEASSANYAEVLAEGFRDVAIGTPVESRPTWDPKNPLNFLGPHSDSPAQRIDHVLIDETSRISVRVASAQLVFAEPCVPTHSGVVTLSDHYGLSVCLALSHA